MNKFLLFIFLAVYWDDENKSKDDEKDGPGGVPVDFGDVTSHQEQHAEANENQARDHVSISCFRVRAPFGVDDLVYRALGRRIALLGRHDDPKDEVDQQSGTTEDEHQEEQDPPKGRIHVEIVA